MNEVNLGTSRREAYNMEDPKVTGGGGDEVIYPSFRYQGPLDLDLPECGTMTIEFRKLDERYDIDPDTGKHTHYECSIQVRCISDVKESERKDPTKSYDEASGALDALMKQREEEEEHD